jgi:hypothetical protein
MTTQFTSAISAAVADLYGHPTPEPAPVVQSCICGCGGNEIDCFYQSPLISADIDTDQPYSYLRWMAKRGYY